MRGKLRGMENKRDRVKVGEKMEIGKGKVGLKEDGKKGREVVDEGGRRLNEVECGDR